MHNYRCFMNFQLLVNVCLALAIVITPKVMRQAPNISKAIAVVSADNVRYNNRLALFVEAAVSTPPPIPADTLPKQTKTCIYFNSQEGIPTPNACVDLLKELNACANMSQPVTRCYDLIGGNDE